MTDNPKQIVLILKILISSTIPSPSKYFLKKLLEQLTTTLWGWLSEKECEGQHTRNQHWRQFTSLQKIFQTEWVTTLYHLSIPSCRSSSVLLFRVSSLTVSAFLSILSLCFWTSPRASFSARLSPSPSFSSLICCMKLTWFFPSLFGLWETLDLFNCNKSPCPFPSTYFHWCIHPFSSPVWNKFVSFRGHWEG